MKIIIDRILQFCTFWLFSIVSFGQNTFSNKHYWEQKIVTDKDLSAVKECSKEQYKVFYDKSMIPKELLKILDGWSEEHITFANPKEDYNSTDNVNSSLPERQIISIFRNSRFMFILYNHGGIGFHRHIIWCQWDGHKITNIWICNCNKKITNLKGLRSYLATFSRVIKLKDGRLVNLNYLCY